MFFYSGGADRLPAVDFVTPVPVDPAGSVGPTKAQASGPLWRRTSPGLYVPAAVDRTVPEQRIVEAVGHLAQGGGLTGWAVMRLCGCRYFDGRTADGRSVPVRLQMGPHNGRRKRPGIELRYDAVGSMTEIRGLPCTPPCWAVFDEARAAKGVAGATVVLDMALRTGFVGLEEMTVFVADRRGCSGVPLVREALALADLHAASPQESRLRLVWQLELGLPRPLVNVAVFSKDGRLLGHPDLLDVAAGLAVEYDGEDHRDARRHSDDVDREAAFREAGIEVTRVTSRDLGNRPALRRRLLAARSRARFEPVERRRWTLSP
jgi:hypothetical protein